MADATSAITVDTAEWTYIDKNGDPHKVTNAETFNVLVSDDGVADVQYNIPISQTVVTDDGYTLEFQPRTTVGNAHQQMAPLTDAGQGSAFHNIRGEMDIRCPLTGIVQNWKPATLTPSDADFGAAGTIAATWEDQFGNKMSWVAGMTVGQAA